LLSLTLWLECGAALRDIGSPVSCKLGCRIYLHPTSHVLGPQIQQPALIIYGSHSAVGLGQLHILKSYPQAGVAHRSVHGVAGVPITQDAFILNIHIAHRNKFL